MFIRCSCIIYCAAILPWRKSWWVGLGSREVVGNTLGLDSPNGLLQMCSRGLNNFEIIPVFTNSHHVSYWKEQICLSACRYCLNPMKRTIGQVKPKLMCSKAVFVCISLSPQGINCCSQQEGKVSGQSRQEAKVSGLVYTLWSLTISTIMILSFQTDSVYIQTQIRLLLAQQTHHGLH